MKKCILLALLLMYFLPGNAGVVRIVNSATTLATEYSAAADGDTLKFTANIVVASTFAVSKSLVILGQGYTLGVPSFGITDGGAINSTASAFRPITFTGTNKHLKIFNLKIKGGAPADLSAQGGCIHVAASDTLTLNFCSVTNGRGGNSGLQGGGGIFSLGVCYLYKTEVKRNGSGYGGGFAINSANSYIYIEQCTISENRSLSTGGGGGGGAAITSAKVYINNSTISSNQSTELGGGLTIYGGSTGYVTNTSFTGNVTYSDTYKGGAVQANAASSQLNLINCLFAYNYAKSAGSGGIPTAPSGFVLDDMFANDGPATINLYYCTYMAKNTSGGGTITDVIGNTTHALAADGSTNDIFTGGVYTNMMGTDGAVYGTGKYFQPYLINVNGLVEPTLKTGSFALGKGTATRFGHTGVTPRIGYYNKTTSTWADITGSTSGTDLVASDQGATARPALPSYPAVGAVERTVDNFYVLKVFASPNGIVNGASSYGDLYPAGDNVTFSALPNTGYAFTSFTSVEGTSGTITSNPATVTMTENKSFNMNFSNTTNFTVTYLPNEATSGTVPSPGSQSYTSGSTATISINAGTLAKTNFTFIGWNTQPNGSGTDYAASGAATYSSASATNLTLYAKWQSTGVPLVALPVRLISYQLQNMNDAAALVQWTVANDDNCAYFAIERSADGIHFQQLGTVKSKNLEGAATYQFTDAHPLTGRNYYRVVSVLVDEEKMYSAIKVLSFGNTLPARYCKVYPNPVVSDILLLDVYSSNNEPAISYFMTDIAGRIIKNGFVLNRQVNQLDVSRCTPGLYLVTVLFNNGERVVNKVQKQ